jgi:hypothetical protein
MIKPIKLRRPCGPSGHAVQGGAISLLVAISLGLLASLASFYSARSVLVDRLASHNQSQAAQARLAAEAALAWARAEMQRQHASGPTPPGPAAFVTQSGAMATAIVDWAAPRKIGFSHLVSLGDMSDVDFGDMLDWLATDGKTRAILLYIEAVTHARKFMSAARAAARLKPVIVIKAGRHAEAAKAAASHTGALAGADAVYDAAFRRAGMLRVDLSRRHVAHIVLDHAHAHERGRLADRAGG